MMKKIRIAFCLVGLDGGVGNLLLNYLDHMDLSDYEIRIIAHDTSSELYRAAFEKRGAKIIPVRSKKQSVIGNFLDIRKGIEGCNIVHAHMTLTNMFPLAAAFSRGISVRISHSHLVEKKTIKSRLLSLGTRLFATEFWACGYEAGKFLYGAKPFFVLNNAIEMKEFLFDPNVRTEERKYLGVTSDELLIGHVGRFTRQKNHSFILQVFREVRKLNSNAKLLLIGEGELFEEIKHEASSMGVSDYIIYTGPIDDVSQKLMAIDLFMLPSLFEGLPVSVIEAEATGAPCVLSDNITKEVGINKNVQYLSLHISKEIWAREIIELSQEKRIVDQSKLIHCGFDISTEAEKLNLLYRKLVVK